MRWYRLAADQSDADAQNNLGVMYGTGQGVIEDDKEAHMWFNIAQSNGEKEYAADNIEILTQYMTPADIAKAQDMARQCLASDYQDC